MAEQVEMGAGETIEELAEELPLVRFLEEVEARYIAHMLRAAGGNQRKAAEKAGLSVQALHRRKRRHGLEVETVAVVRRRARA